MKTLHAFIIGGPILVGLLAISAAIRWQPNYWRNTYPEIHKYLDARKWDRPVFALQTRWAIDNGRPATNRLACEWNEAKSHHWIECAGTTHITNINGQTFWKCCE